MQALRFLGHVFCLFSMAGRKYLSPEIAFVRAEARELTMTGQTQEIPAEQGVVNVSVERKGSIFLPETRKQTSYDQLGRVLTLP